MIMEITLLIMEKSWKNHGILFLNFCGNPVLNNDLLYCKSGISEFEPQSGHILSLVEIADFKVGQLSVTYKV